MKFEPTTQEQEFLKLKTQTLIMTNFILAALIFGGIVYAVYRIGLLIWG